MKVKIKKYLCTLDEFRVGSELNLKNGDIIKDYFILSYLGKGSFGSVMKAENIQTKKIVAIKVIKKNPVFYKQGLVEIEFLNIIRDRDPLDEFGFGFYSPPLLPLCYCYTYLLLLFIIIIIIIIIYIIPLLLIVKLK